MWRQRSSRQLAHVPSYLALILTRPGCPVGQASAPPQPLPYAVAAQVTPVDGAVVLASSARPANASLKALRNASLKALRNNGDASVDTLLPQPLPTMYRGYGMTGVKSVPARSPDAARSPEGMPVWPLPAWLASPYTEATQMPPVRSPRRRMPWRKVLDVSPRNSQAEFSGVVPHGGRLAFS